MERTAVQRCGTRVRRTLDGTEDRTVQRHGRQSGAVPGYKGQMKAAETITKAVDFFYAKPLRRMIPLETFRYIVCGGANMLLGWLLYALLYKYVIRGAYLDLGFVVMSPHVLALAVQFVITFFTGFWLNRNVTFALSTLSGGRQLFRYVLQTAGALLLNYLLLKLFVEGAHLYAPLARPLTDAAVVVYSYLTARFFTFRTAVGKDADSLLPGRDNPAADEERKRREFS